MREAVELQLLGAERNSRVKNRSQAPARHPDIEWEAQLSKDGNQLGSGLCRVWTPRSFSDRVIVEFEIHEPDVGMLPPPFTIRAERKVMDGGTEYLCAEGVWFSSIPQVSSQFPPRRAPTAIGTPEILVLGQRFGRRLNSNASKQSGLTFQVSNNSLLEPVRVITRDVAHGIHAETKRAVKIEWRESHFFEFDRHFEFRPGSTADATEMRSLLTASTLLELEQDVRNVVSKSVLPALRDVLHVASFAARTDTRAFKWEAMTAAERIEVYLANVAPIHRAEEDDGSRDTLIQKPKFEEFMAVAMRALHGEDRARAELSRLAVIKATPRRGEYVESRYLSLFSALESVLLLYRRQEHLEFTAQKSSWKKLRKAIEQCIDENAALFASDFHRDSAARSVAGLKRIPISGVFRKFADSYGIRHSDLWPVFETSLGVSLADLRNRLAHGETIGNRRLDAFITALCHLEVLVERCCLALLGWDWGQSTASEHYVKSYRQQFDEQSIAEGMAAFAGEDDISA